MDAVTGVFTGLVANFIYDYFRDQLRTYIAPLQKREQVSEVLVGFVPEISDKEKAQLALENEVSIAEKTVTLQSAQNRIDALAVELLGKLHPIKSESNLPGLGSVEYDLSQLRDNNVDSSWLTNMVRLTATPSMIGKLTRTKQVAFVVPNFEVKLPSPVEVTEEELKRVQKKEKEQKRTWGIELLRVHELWERGLTGKNVLIGHLDTGVDASHPDLQEKIRDFALFDPRGQQVRCDAFDSDEHGTQTAGIIVGGNNSGISIGVAPEAKLVSALVLMRGNGTTWQIIKGIEWAIDQKVRILNMSLGGVGYNSVYEYALARVAEVGVFLSCSIGNNGTAVTGSPGNLSSACGVGAINSNREVADFSGGGSISWYNSLGQLMQIHKPDVVAPGVAVFSSLPQGRWGYVNGTSMAAPHVSGVAALLIQAKPSAPLKDLIQAIYSTARHSTAPEKRQDSRFGRGIINPVHALERLVS
ncbi:hypothetical protein FJZ31_08725 [Candidatus Poribacteria bacterium]|nr:hypothetical protein [Candidatus Poribacteria bacterium]